MAPRHPAPARSRPVLAYPNDRRAPLPDSLLSLALPCHLFILFHTSSFFSNMWKLAHDRIPRGMNSSSPLLLSISCWIFSISRQFVFLQLSVLLTIQPAIPLGFNRCLCHLHLPETPGVCRWKQRRPLLSAPDINSDPNVLYLPFSVCFAQDLCLTLHALVSFRVLGFLTISGLNFCFYCWASALVCFFGLRFQFSEQARILDIRVGECTGVRLFLCP